MNSIKKIAIVTGSSRGIGRDAVLRLAARGVSSIVTYQSRRTDAEDVVALVKAAGADAQKWEDLLFAQALAQTDCGGCGYDTCRAYAKALLAGVDDDVSKCGPGGFRTTRDLGLLIPLRRPARTASVPD